MVALTRDEAVAKVKRGLGFRTDLDTEVLLELRLAQDLLEQGQSLPWWLRVDSTIAGTGASSTLTAPTGFIRFDEEYELYTIDSTTGKQVEIKIVDIDQLKRLSWDEDTQALEVGAPTALAIRGTTFTVAPIPAANFTVYGSWYAKDEDLNDVAADETNLWLTYAPLVLVGMAGETLARDLHDDTAITNFQSMYAVANSRLIADIEQRKSRTYQVGGEQ